MTLIFPQYLHWNAISPKCSRLIANYSLTKLNSPSYLSNIFFSLKFPLFWRSNSNPPSPLSCFFSRSYLCFNSNRNTQFAYLRTSREKLGKSWNRISSGLLQFPSAEEQPWNLSFLGSEGWFRQERVDPRIGSLWANSGLFFFV